MPVKTIMVDIITLAHREQRYDTVGDWRTDYAGVDFHISVSELGDWRYELLVGIHELIEAALCKHRGISEEVVTDFDTNYAGEFDEPGADSRAPYHAEHMFAMRIEEQIAAELGVDWATYDNAIQEL